MATEEGVGPSQRGEDEPLFLESESEGAKARSETAVSEIPCDVAVELMEALWVQTSTFQGQAHLKEAVHSNGVTVDLPRPAPELAAGAAQGSASCGTGLQTRVGARIGCMDRVWRETGGVVRGRGG